MNKIINHRNTSFEVADSAGSQSRNNFSRISVSNCSPGRPFGHCPRVMKKHHRRVMRVIPSTNKVTITMIQMDDDTKIHMNKMMFQ